MIAERIQVLVSIAVCSFKSLGRRLRSVVDDSFLSLSRMPFKLPFVYLEPILSHNQHGACCFRAFYPWSTEFPSVAQGSQSRSREA